MRNAGRSRRLQLAAKQAIDVVASAIALALLSPILLVIALLVKMGSPGPVLFRQERVGKGGRRFRVFKFRTMIAGAEKLGMGLRTAAYDPRITAVGKWLRWLSLDELPQLLNVLNGSMSLVGPRPPVPHHPKTFENYDSSERKRFEMRPGITGWAMVNGRNLNPWPVRIRYDVEYIDNFNLWLDLKILFRTLGTVVLRKGIYLPDGGPAAPEGTGTVSMSRKGHRKREHNEPKKGAGRQAAGGELELSRDYIRV